MMERFTREAREAVIEAQAVAREAGSQSIDTRHVLVGVLERSRTATAALDAIGVDRAALTVRLRRELGAGDLDAEALAGLGIDLDAVRRRADDVFGRGALDRARRTARRGHIPFTSDAKKSLELTLREAVRCGLSELRGDVILLGILATIDSPGAVALSGALLEAGVGAADLERVVTGPEAAAS